MADEAHRLILFGHSHKRQENAAYRNVSEISGNSSNHFPEFWRELAWLFFPPTAIKCGN